MARRALLAVALLAARPLVAEPPDDGADPLRLPPVTVVAPPEDLSRVGGSVQRLEEDALDTFDHHNPEAALQSVTGVNMRGEDGHGLRPNIGIRGTSPERSKKVTLMEDGILFAPAPYSAPAAYYFPMMPRIVGLEVTKGPAGIPYGPNTIGGAINLLTRDIPRGMAGAADVGFGTDTTVRGHAWWGLGRPRWGVLTEAVHVQSDGFKELDGGGDTGFRKTELLAKGRWTSDPLADVYHRLDARAGLTLERSHETYLGLSDADFEADPDRRYRASALDLMENWRTTARLAYTLQVGEDLDARLTLYRHDFDRSWRKLNRFAGGPALSSILADPSGGVREVFYRVLTGAEDSAGGDDALMIGTTARRFVAQGADALFRYAFDTAPVRHELRAGLRYHFDSVRRDHTEDGYLMTGGALESDGGSTAQTTDNTDSTHALAGWATWALHWRGLTLTPGMRAEFIVNKRIDRRADRTDGRRQLVALGGFGAHYDIGWGLGVLAGVHQGFSPVSPGQPDEQSPERSVNYEAGLRWTDEAARSLGEAVFFFNDYSNLVGQCAFSSGCSEDDLDRQFNGGAAHILGVEVAGHHAVALGCGYELPLRGAYTYTRARFRSAFSSSHPEWGDVSAGDVMPYVPEHQARLELGVDHRLWGATVAGAYTSAAREIAGPPDPPAAERTDAVFLLDATARWSPLDWLEVYLRGENLTAARPIASRRPFGARPGRPLVILGGVRLSLP